MTLLSALIWNLELVKRGGHSRLELDSVPGVDWEELFDMNGFSELHKIVYGVSGRPLDAELDARPEDLDRPDNLGLTPLWYACWLGKSNHVRILIQYGADVNSTYIPPMCAAVWRRSHDLVEQLLNADASITGDLVDFLYIILLDHPSGLGEEHLNEVLAIDKALFGRLLDIDHRPSIGIRPPPLVVFARQSTSTSHARMRQLLELGADIELSDTWGMTPLGHAISTGNTEGCKILVRAGANVNAHTNTGQTILHLAITNAKDIDTIQAVSELDLSGVELGASDVSGYIAFEILTKRAGRQRNNRYPFPAFYPFDSPWDDKDVDIREDYVKDIDTELQILLAFQTLLQQLQEARGIPIEDRYPLLNLTRESRTYYLLKDRNPETDVPSVPGAWHEE